MAQVQGSGSIIRRPQLQGLPDYAVQLESRAEEIIGKMNGRVLGISGVGGIGKTTLAKQVFNTIYANFEYSCFIENVKDIPLSQLKEVISGAFQQRGRRVKQGNIQWPDLGYLKGKNTLIVLDDVDSEDQLHVLPELVRLGLFGPHSCRLIITSRNKDIFRHYKNIPFPHDTTVYEVDLLEEHDAMELFCRHAFGQEGIPDHALEENVKAVVEICQGLPLALEVLGSHLKGHEGNAEVWEETIDKLGKAQSLSDPDDRVRALLRVSYNSLREEDQEIFIDAATFFFQKPLHKFLAAWSSASGRPEMNWANLAEVNWAHLVSKSLVKEVWSWEGTKVWVHDQLRDLAKSIGSVNMVSASDQEAALLVEKLDTNEVNPDIRSLQLLYPQHSQGLSSSNLHSTWLSRLSGLKFLELNRVPLDDKRPFLTSNLCFLSWSPKHPNMASPTLPISFEKLDHLAVLELCDCYIPWDILQELSHLPLRSLFLSRVRGLKGLDKYFGKFFPYLQDLHISDCPDLRVLGVALRDLPSLRRLELTNATIQSLPGISLGSSALEDLTIRDSKCKTLPEQIYRLTSLRNLRMECEELESLPDTICSLKLLKRLTLWCPKLKRLPKRFGELAQRAEIDLNVTSGVGVPLSAVQESLLPDWSLEDLPSSAVQGSTLPDSSVSSLVPRLQWAVSGPQLNIHCPNVKTLPEDLLKLLSPESRQLTGVEILSIDCSDLETLPNWICPLPSLRKLTLKCPKLKELPENLGTLTALSKIEVQSKELQGLPESVSALTSLQELTLKCPKLKKLPEGLGELTQLEEVELVLSVEDLPARVDKWSHLRLLRVLSTTAKLCRCTSEKAEKTHVYMDFSSPKLQTLPENLWKLASLKSGQLIPLQRLSIDCTDLEELPDNWGEELTSLETLSITAGRVESLPESMEQLRSLTTLNLKAPCLRSLPENFGNLTALREFNLKGDQFEELPDSFYHLASLRELRLHCPKLKKPERIGELSKLENLELVSQSMDFLPESVGEMSSLHRLKFSNSVAKLVSNSGAIKTAMPYLEIYSPHLKTLPEDVWRLASMGTLVKQILPLQLLTINCANLKALPEDLGKLSSLETMHLTAGSMKSLPESIGQLGSLKTLVLCVPCLTVLPGSVGQLTALRDFEFDCDGHEHLPYRFERFPFAALKLKLTGSKTRVLPAGFGVFPSLKDLTLERLPELTRLPEEVGRLSSVERLTLNSCHNLQSLPDSLVQLSSLEKLTIKSCDRLESLPGSLGQVTSLRELTLGHLLEFKKLPEEVGTLPALERLTIDTCPMLESLPDSLWQVSSLQKVKLSCCRCLSLGASPTPPAPLPLPPRFSRGKAEERGTFLEVMQCPFLNASVLELLGVMWKNYTQNGKDEGSYSLWYRGRQGANGHTHETPPKQEEEGVLDQGERSEAGVGVFSRKTFTRPEEEEVPEDSADEEDIDEEDEEEEEAPEDSADEEDIDEEEEEASEDSADEEENADAESGESL